jgi:D-tyrosyl-tRNA(Tyr) deacylase
MKVVVQRSLQSSVKVNSKVISSIEKGLVLLVCLESGDNESTVKKSIQKILALRIFSDENGRMNKNIVDVKGEVLAISQFTLSWNGKKGNRPSFDGSMKPEFAEKMFDNFCDEMSQNVDIYKGAFGESMEVSIVNDGPVTFHLEF